MKIKKFKTYIKCDIIRLGESMEETLKTYITYLKKKNHCTILRNLNDLFHIKLKSGRGLCIVLKPKNELVTIHRRVALIQSYEATTL